MKKKIGVKASSSKRDMDAGNLELDPGVRRIRCVWFWLVVVASVLFFTINLFFSQKSFKIVESGSILTFWGILEKVDAKIWLFLVSVTLPVNIYILLYYAPLILPNLNHLRSVFNNDKFFQKLCEDYHDWLKFPSKYKKEHFGIVKIIYLILWVVYALSFGNYAFARLPSALPISSTCWLLIIVGTTNILLNFFVYYKCACYTYFLYKAYDLVLNRENALSYVEEYPSATYGFQMLNHTVRRICTCFFLDSFLSTIAHISFLGVVFPGDKLNAGWNLKFVSFIYINIFMIIFGLASWGVIMLLSRVYLRQIHNIWKLRSLKKLQEHYDRAMDCSKREEIACKMNTITHDNLFVDVWERIMSITTLIANLATAGITIDIFQKL